MPTLESIERAADRRVRILDAIVESVREREYPPSVTELAQTFGVSRRQIDIDLAVLVEAGKIERDAGVARGLRVVKS